VDLEEALYYRHPQPYDHRFHFLRIFLGIPRLEHLCFQRSLLFDDRGRTAFVDHFTSFRPALRSLTPDMPDMLLHTAQVMDLLTSSAATLRFLEMRNVTIGPWRGQSSMPVFPRVHTFRLWDVREFCPLTLLAAFPVVQRLSVAELQAGEANDNSGWTFDDGYTGTQKATPPWTEFEDVHVSLGVFRRLSLNGINTRHLAITVSIHSTQHTEHIGDIFRRVSADVLRVNIRLDVKFSAKPFPHAANTIILDMRVTIWTNGHDPYASPS
jgi:hypothetical protein